MPGLQRAERGLGSCERPHPGGDRGEAGRLSNEAYTYKIFWATWRKKLGVLALDVLGPRGEIAMDAPYEWDLLPRLFLASRADTIYGGTNQIQRNIIAERALGLPRESRSP